MSNQSIFEKINNELLEMKKDVYQPSEDKEQLSKVKVLSDFVEALKWIPLNDRQLNMLMNKNIISNFYSFYKNTEFKELGIEENDIASITAFWIKANDIDDSKSRLIEKVKQEYNDFIQEMKCKPPEVIISSAYEISTKEDIVSEIECGNLGEKDIDTLLSMEKPVDTIFIEWMANGLSVMDFIEDTIKDVVEDREVEIKMETPDYVVTEGYLDTDVENDEMEEIEP